MWNILIVIIIAIIIWAFNPLAHLNPKTSLGGIDQETRNDINQVENQAIQQVNQARQIQKEQENTLDNPQ